MELLKFYFVKHLIYLQLIIVMNFEFIYSSFNVRTRLEVLLFTTMVVGGFTHAWRCYYFVDGHYGLKGIVDLFSQAWTSAR